MYYQLHDVARVIAAARASKGAARLKSVGNYRRMAVVVRGDAQ